MPSTNKTQNLSEELYNYILGVSLRESDLLRELREETAQMPNADLQASPELGQFMALLARLTGAKRALEIGVFTGYSSLWVLEAMPADSSLIACDISAEYTAVARRYWEKAGVADRVDLRIGPALASLDKLLADGAANSFDFAFIDADKVNYPGYYDRAIQLVRPGGLIVIDNVIYHGRVIDQSQQDDFTNAVRALNEQLHNDDRIYLSLVPLGDGVTLALKK